MFEFIGKVLWFFELKKKEYIQRYLQKKYSTKAKYIGRCVRFNGVSYIGAIENVEIGNNVHIGDNAYISAKGGLYIGDNTHISRNLLLYTDNHNYQGELLPYDNTYILKKVTIEKNVWIGMNVTILPGTYIREGAIVGAGTVVSGIIEKNAIVGASLGKVLKTRDTQHYSNLEMKKAYGGISGREIKESCK